MRTKNTINCNYIMFLIITLMYFIPKYLEFTTFCHFEEVEMVIFVLKNASYVCAIIWYLLKTTKKNRISSKLLFAICLSGMYLIYQALFKDVNAIFVVFLLSLIFEEQYFYKYIKIIFGCSCILYVVTIVACKIGIIENAITDRYKFGSTWTAGGNGFEYSGQMIMMLIPIVFMYYFLKKNKITLLDNLFWIGITIIVFSQCKTITGMALILIFILLFNIICKGKGNWIIKSRLVRMLPIICCVIISFLELLYRNGIIYMNIIDGLLNGRLSVTDRVIDRYGIGLWGSGFENNTLDGKYEIIDSEYLYYALKAGIIYLIVSLVLGVFVIRYVQRKNDVCLTLIWSMIFVNAIVNNGIWGIVMNPFGILLIPAIKDYLIGRKR